MLQSRLVSAGLATIFAAASVTAIVTPAAAAVEGVPNEIRADCSVDVTASIQAWIDGVPDESTLQFGTNACYRVDGTLQIRRRVGLTIDGQGATFRQVTDGSELVNPTKVRARNVWSFLANTRLTVRDITVIGANPYAGRGDRAYRAIYEAQHAYLVQGGTDTLLERVQAYDTYGDFVWVGPGTKRLTVRDSTFSRNGRQGWTINGEDILFERNSISETRRATIDMEPTLPTWSSKNVTIRYNTIGKGRLLFFANVGAASAVIDGVNIVGNRFVGKTMQILVAGAPGTRNNYHVVGNVSDGITSGSGGTMSFTNVIGLEVRSNVQRVQAAHHLEGVGLRKTHHVQIRGNTWHHADGVWIDRGGNVDVVQWNNAIRNPAAIQPRSVTPGPTPVPTA